MSSSGRRGSNSRRRKLSSNTLSIAEHLGLFDLSFFLCLCLASILHRFCPRLRFLVVDGRVDQLNMAIAFRNPSVGRRCRPLVVLCHGSTRCRRGSRAEGLSLPRSVIQDQGPVTMRYRSSPRRVVSSSIRCPARGVMARRVGSRGEVVLALRRLVLVSIDLA